MKRISVVPPPTDADTYLGDREPGLQVRDSGGVIGVQGPSTGTEERSVVRASSEEESRAAPAPPKRMAMARAGRGDTFLVGKNVQSAQASSVPEETWPTPIHLGALELELLDGERTRRMRVPRSKRKNKEKLTRSSLVREAVRAYFGGDHK